MLKFTLAATMLVLVASAGAQTFTNVANYYGIQALSNGGDYGGGVTFFDYDGDGWDDLTICRNSLDILRYKNVNGSFEPDEGFTNNADAKQVSYADIDNDGDYDVLITRNYSPLQLLRNDGSTYTDISENSGLTLIFNGYTFGATWGDYDKDGFLDVYVCNYNLGDGVTNWLFHNNGDLTFTEVGQELGVDNGSLTSFQAVWLDINHDTWPDLYVVNDKTPPNAMYLNQGDGTFVDISVSSGTNIVIDGMTNTVADFNHDGLLDIYITDDGPANQLLQNQGNNFFSNVAPSLGVDNGLLCWGAQWIDWNNDGNRDLYFVTTTPIMNNQNYFYKQELDGTYSQYPQAFLFLDEVGAYTNAKADFDQNGYEDLILGCHIQNARLYANSGGNNNFLRIGLEGVVSNRDGIGAWITCHFNGMTEVEYTICGESFMSQNSHYDLFGLGQAEIVDSLFVEWPSGHVDSFYNIPVNQTLEILEGESLHISFENSVICPDDSVCFELAPEYEYLWSNGTTSPQICFQEEGNYWVNGLTPLGIPFGSDTLYIDLAPTLEMEVTTQHVACFGAEDGEIQVLLGEAVPAEENVLLNGEIIEPIDLTIGEYFIQAWDDQGCLYTDSITIVQPDSMIHSLQITHNLCFGDSLGTVNIETIGGTAPYEYSYDQDPAGLPAGELIIWVEDSNNCIDSLFAEIISPPPLEVAINIFEAQEDMDGSIFVVPNGGTPPYSILWDNGETELELDLPAGNYQFTLTDDHDCQLDSIVALPLDLTELRAGIWKIYPNPASDVIHIQGLDNSPFSYRMLDLQGKEYTVPTIELIPTKQTLDISQLTPGFYILYIYWPNHSHPFLLVVE